MQWARVLLGKLWLFLSLVCILFCHACALLLKFQIQLSETCSYDFLFSVVFFLILLFVSALIQLLHYEEIAYKNSHKSHCWVNFHHLRYVVRCMFTLKLYALYRERTENSSEFPRQKSGWEVCRYVCLCVCVRWPLVVLQWISFIFTSFLSIVLTN